MMELKGLSSVYAAVESLADKQRKLELEKHLPQPAPVSQPEGDVVVRQGRETNGDPRPKGASPFPYQPLGPVSMRDYSPFHFQKGQPQTRVGQAQGGFSPAAELLSPPNMPAWLRYFPAVLERLGAQVAAFYFGNRRDLPTEAEKRKRLLNDLWSPSLLSSRKVEQSHQSELGKGER